MRTMSTRAVSAINQPQTSEVFLYLLDITLKINSVETTYHFVNNTEKIIRNSITYIPLAFKIVLPAEGETISEAQLSLDAVDLIMIEAFRRAEEAPKAAFIVILASAPNDAPEAGPFNFDIKEVNYNAQAITCSLALSNTLDATYPRVTKTPYFFPGLF